MKHIRPSIDYYNNIPNMILQVGYGDSRMYTYLALPLWVERLFLIDPQPQKMLMKQEIKQMRQKEIRLFVKKLVVLKD